MDTTMIIEPYTNFSNTEEIIGIKDTLYKVLENKAVPGVSAPELGINYSIFYVKNIPGEDWIFAINPKIVNYSDQKSEYHETCYSYPGIKVKIIRPYTVRVRFQDLDGQTITRQLEGPVARLFQHEMVHMVSNAEPFWNAANFLHKNKAVKDWKSLSRKLHREI